MTSFISDRFTGISELGLDKSAHFSHFLKMFGSPLIRYSLKSLKDCAAIYPYVKCSLLSNLDNGDNNFR
jgi:hypothetical protein